MLTPLDELLEPISPESPTGRDLRGEEVFDELRGLRPPLTLDDMERGGLADRAKKFGPLRQRAENVLRFASKDLQVAAWLTEAWTHLEGVAGLVHGLELQRRLVEEYWDTVHPLPAPVSPSPRRDPLLWTADNVADSLLALPVTRGGETVSPLLDVLKQGREAGGVRDYPWMDSVIRDVGKTGPEFWLRLGSELLQVLVAVESFRDAVRRKGFDLNTRSGFDDGVSDFLRHDFSGLRERILDIGWLIGELSAWARVETMGPDRMNSAFEVLSVDAMLLPISPDAPAGADLRYDPIQDEIRGLRKSSLASHNPDGPRFRTIRTVAEDVLMHRSKDLQVAAWLTEAWVNLEGAPGLVAGLELQRRLLDEFWDTLHPQLEPGDPDLRLAPIRWTAGYLAPSLSAIPITTGGATVADVHRALSGETPHEGSLAEFVWDGVNKQSAQFWRRLAIDLENGRIALKALANTVSSRLTADLWADHDWQPGVDFTPLRDRIDEVDRLRTRLQEGPHLVEGQPNG